MRMLGKMKREKEMTVVEVRQREKLLSKFNRTSLLEFSLFSNSSAKED
jgi:hypothetical protein